MSCLGVKLYPRELGTNLIIPFASPDMLNFCNNGLEFDFLCCNQVTQLQETCTVEFLGKLEIHESMWSIWVRLGALQLSIIHQASVYLATRIGGKERLWARDDGMLGEQL